LAAVFSLLTSLVVILALVLLIFWVSRSIIDVYRKFTPEEISGPDVNFYRDMRGRLGEFRRMRNWCLANIGAAADTPSAVNHEQVFFIGKFKSDMQFVFYNQSDFDLFNQHWSVVQESHERHS